MILPDEILDIIFKYVNNIKLIVSFRNILSNNTIKYILDNNIENITNEVSSNNIPLFKIILDINYLVNWDNISRYQIISEDFIREFANKVNWYEISKYQISYNQTLSEDFIREFANKVWHF